MFSLCRQCNEKRGNELVDVRTFYTFADSYFIDEVEKYYLIWKQNNTN